MALLVISGRSCGSRNWGSSRRANWHIILHAMSTGVHTNLDIFFSSPGFVWTEALNHVILLLFVLVVISHAPNSMQPQCFFRVHNSKWRCWWSAEGRKVSREQKLGLEQTCQLACHTSCYVHTNMNIFFSNPGFVWTGALSHVILLLFVLVVVLTVRRCHCRRLGSCF